MENEKTSQTVQAESEFSPALVLTITDAEKVEVLQATVENQRIALNIRDLQVRFDALQKEREASEKKMQEIFGKLYDSNRLDKEKFIFNLDTLVFQPRQS